MTQSIKWIFGLLIAAAILSLPSKLVSVTPPPFAVADFNCLVKNAYYEARGEGLGGMLAVTAVAMNRMKRDKENACTVIFKPKQWAWTATRSLSQHLKDVDSAALAAYAVYNRLACGDGRLPAGEATGCRQGEGHVRGVEGRVESPIYLATHYHAKHVRPVWANKMHKLGIIGNHIFYKERK